jgi:hypothetical protein
VASFPSPVVVEAAASCRVVVAVEASCRVVVEALNPTAASEADNLPRDTRVAATAEVVHRPVPVVAAGKMPHADRSVPVLVVVALT